GDVGRQHARGVVAQCLRREPVLAVTAMEITAEHAEREGVRAGERVEERLFLSRIALQGRHVAGRHLQRPVLVEAHLADAPPRGAAGQRMEPGASSYSGTAVWRSRGDKPRTLVTGYMMSVVSDEWSSPMRWPISWSAMTRTSAGPSGCPLGSKVARVTMAVCRCPSWSQVRSVWPVRSSSNCTFHLN